MSLSLWFLVCATVLAIEELLKTALAMRGGFGLSQEHLDPTLSHLVVILALSTGSGKGVRKSRVKWVGINMPSALLVNPGLLNYAYRD